MEEDAEEGISLLNFKTLEIKRELLKLAEKIVTYKKKKRNQYRIRLFKSNTSSKNILE